MLYIPAAVHVEIEDIKREENITKNSKALNKLVSYARVGREVNRLSQFNPSIWGKKVRLPSIESLGLEPIRMNLDNNKSRGRRKK